MLAYIVYGSHAHGLLRVSHTNPSSNVCWCMCASFVQHVPSYIHTWWWCPPERCVCMCDQLDVVTCVCMSQSLMVEARLRLDHISVVSSPILSPQCACLCFVLSHCSLDLIVTDTHTHTFPVCVDHALVKRSHDPHPEGWACVCGGGEDTTCLRGCLVIYV